MHSAAHISGTQGRDGNTYTRPARWEIIPGGEAGYQPHGHSVSFRGAETEFNSFLPVARLSATCVWWSQDEN